LASNEQVAGLASVGDREALRRLFEDTRRRLVETGTRNRLVHVNRVNTRGSVLNIVNGRSNIVYSTLSGRKTMRFRAMGSDVDEAGEALGPVEVGDEQSGPGIHIDMELATRLGTDALERKLLKIANEAKTAEDEQGVNILYLALGFLKWFEDKNSTLPREAPLVLLPVELVRNQRTSTYDLRLRDDDLVPNLPLQQRLKDEAGIKLPEIEVEDGWQPSDYFEQVQAIISSRDRWAIDRDGMQLGFFSFSKLLMFRDLAPASWPDDALENHPLARGLLFEGFASEPAVFDSEDRLDTLLPPSKLFHVVDADASQACVIEEVRAGRNLVVQGPPGTGKSQTITNIIASAAKEGKTVLFVAEKMAALSVVHDRLVKVGLQDTCLELHSKSANKKVVLAELARTLGAAQAVPHLPDAPLALTEVRDRLNEITAALHAPIGASGETGFSVLARQARYIGIGAAPPSLETGKLATLTRPDEALLCEAIESYGTLLKQTGSPAEHPLYGIRRTDLQPVDLSRLTMALVQARERVAALAGAIDAAIAATGIDLLPSLSIVAPLLDILDLLAKLPPGTGLLASQAMGAPDKPRLELALGEALAWRSARDAADEIFMEDAFSVSLSGLRITIAAGKRSFLARWAVGYRKASRELGAVLRGNLPKSASERLALIDHLAEMQEQFARWRGDEPYLAGALGDFWRGDRTDFDGARAASKWGRQLSEAKLPIASDRAIALAELPDGVVTLARTLRQAAPPARQSLDEITHMLALDLATFETDDISKVNLRTILDRLRAFGTAVDRYGEWTQLSRLRARMGALGSGVLADRMDAGELDGPRAVIEVCFARAERLWHDARRSLPALREIGSVDRHQLVARFANLDRDRLKENVAAIRAGHLAQMPQGAMGEMKVIRGEIGKKKAHIALRKLFAMAPTAIQRIKPVLLMSPISIAQFLPPGALTFDLLVIDEASQVRPEDALGAIARARQIVVVGDQKQLPPTSFFDRLLADENDDQDDEPAETDLLGGAAKLGDLESILSLCEARGLSSRMLKWHYRSRDPSLIRVSNREFYEDKLILPPSLLQNDPAYGLCFTRVDGVYDRGGKRDNRKEGEAVVKRVAEHARNHPALSLGIGTFSSAQRNLITEILEIARRKDSILDYFLREGKSEDVFVKNIENVQGDERDVILVSVGYGPSTPGGHLSSMSFGPVNGDGGERRLNVLFTRARVRCEIFASFDPGDIDLSRATRDGPRIFKRFLEFAKSGRIDEAIPTGELPDSPFEEDVADVIRRLGFIADPQVGSSGFRIDLGIRHKDRPGTYILAVECDGATYHSALWARERDRLRQDVLEHLGWRFYRIWSTDWFYNRSAEIDRLRAALISGHEAAEAGITIDGANHHMTADRAATEDEAILRIPDAVERRMPRYVRAVFPNLSGVEPHEADRTVLARLAIAIVESEGPIHIEEIARRIATSFGRERTGTRILSATKAALGHAQLFAPHLLTEESFWQTRGQLESPPVRDRSAEEGATLKALSISLIEIRAAIKVARDDNAGGDDSDLIRIAARLLGFRRVGSELQARMVQGLQGL
jgi:hypothetical protein